ncbi:MAG TPA: hypothetical protein VM121_06690 [Acidimicrobiales bacterium]|nr:hypothetical protein [Acidimicrobiales bacterium]
MALLAACSGGGSEKETVYAPPRLPTSTTTASALAAPPGPPTPGAPVTSAAPSGSSPAGAASGGSSAPGEGESPSAFEPPRTGTYRYDTSGVSTFALTSVPYPAVSTLTVAGGDEKQRWTRDLRDAGGSGSVSEFALDFRTDGVYLDDLTLTNGFQGMVNVQKLHPSSPPLLVPGAVGPGGHSEFDLHAEDGGVAHATVDVTGKETVTVGGQSVDTLVVRTRITLPAGDVSGQVELTGWFAPSARIWAKEHFVADASAAGGLFTFHSQYDATAQSLSPS